MIAARQSMVLTPLLLTIVIAHRGFTQEVNYEERNGIKYQVTRQVIKQQIPATVMRERQQTQYVQQVTTDTVNHQQVYCVPVTQYQMSSHLRGRWNPFVTPYWTYQLEPVTHWQQQVANVQIPVNRVAWVPQTTTVQVPVTEYRTAEKEIVTRVAVGDQRSGTSSRQARNRQSTSTGPSATIAARPSNASRLGGVALENDPPRQATGEWQNPSRDSRYR